MSGNAGRDGAGDRLGNRDAMGEGRFGASSVEGGLTISIQRFRGGAVRVRINSSRLVNVGRMLVGRTPQEALLVAPMIFSLCGMAHGAAGAAAFEEALGRRASEDVRLAREIIVAAETAREHVLRIVLEWPRFLGETVPRSALAGVKDLVEAPQKVAAALFGGASAFSLGAPLKPDCQAAIGTVETMEAFLENNIFGVRPDVWLSNWAGEGRSDDDDVCGERFGRWGASRATVAARLVFAVLSRGWGRVGAAEPFFLPELDKERLLSHLCSDGAWNFMAEPAWNGVPCETGPFARERGARLTRAVAAVYGAGVLARLAARLSELARLPRFMRERLREMQDLVGGDLWDEGGCSGDAAKVGAAQVEAARGLLVHAVELHEGKVARYWIVAPTEWNFHPKGVAFRALASLRAADDDELRRQAELVVHAVDPCVAFDLRIV